jgi:hypothetical protein
MIDELILGLLSKEDSISLNIEERNELVAELCAAGYQDKAWGTRFGGRVNGREWILYLYSSGARLGWFKYEPR